MSNTDQENSKETHEVEHSGRKRCDEKDELVIEALSCAEHVAGNRSFDHNVDTGNHPWGSSLRNKLEQRWNDLILATATSVSSTGNSVRRDVSDINSSKCSYLPASETSEFWFRNIYNRHTSCARYYHTVVHLWEMFELLDIVISGLGMCEWYVPMAWAVFFHDSIYDPKSNRNEKDSAEFFRQFFGACMSKTMKNVTFDIALTMILATEKHKVIPRSEAMSTEDKMMEVAMQEYFLDIDMAILGKHQDAYFNYAALIRKEYEFVSHNVYCSKRAEILETFLVGKISTADSGSNNHSMETEYIYLTESFRAAFEDRARANLREEIKLLRANTIPE